MSYLLKDTELILHDGIRVVVTFTDTPEVVLEPAKEISSGHWKCQTSEMIPNEPGIRTMHINVYAPYEAHVTEQLHHLIVTLTPITILWRPAFSHTCTKHSVADNFRTFSVYNNSSI